MDCKGLKCDYAGADAAGARLLSRLLSSAAGHFCIKSSLSRPLYYAPLGGKPCPEQPKR